METVLLSPGLQQHHSLSPGSCSLSVAFCLAPKPGFLLLFLLHLTNTRLMRIYLHAHKYAYVHDFTPTHCNHVIYSPLEVDDFRYFSSAVSSKQLPVLTLAPAMGSSYTFDRGYPTKRGHEPFRYPEGSLRSWTKVKLDVYDVIEIGMSKRSNMIRLLIILSQSWPRFREQEVGE